MADYKLIVHVVKASNLTVGPTTVTVKIGVGFKKGQTIGETQDSIGLLEVECWCEFDLEHASYCFTRNKLASTRNGGRRSNATSQATCRVC
jgi:hypothetical protein